MRFYIILFFFFVGISDTYAQESNRFESKYQSKNENLPDWVKWMYQDNPNLKVVTKAYELYYRTHPFIKNEFTQYYKRWIRDKWIYEDAQGNYVEPSKEALEKHRSNYLKLVERSKNSIRNNANWEELGPWEYDHEATMDLSVQSPGSAHVYTVEQSKSNPDVVYAGTANAGIWKSMDKGMSWELMTRDYYITNVYSLEIDHTNENIVYAYSGSRIWKTSDGGVTWSETAGGQSFSWVRDIRMSPNNAQIVFAASTSGLYQTSDGGNNWTLLKSGHFQEIEFHPTDSDIIYAVKHTNNRTELYKSEDAGVSFSLKHDGWPGISSVSSTGSFSSCDFDGSNYVDLDNVDLGSSTTPNFTIELRVKSSGWSGDPAIISNKNWSSGGNKGFIIAANGNGWKFNIGDGSSRIDLDGWAINDNEWHHIVVSYEATGDKKLYQNGVLVSSTDVNISTDVESGLDLSIAQDGTFNYWTNFEGNISEVRIWDMALSEADIIDGQCSEIDNTHPQYNSLLHYWKMDEAVGTNIADSKGNNDGIVNGGSQWTANNTMNCIETDLESGEEQNRTEISVSEDTPDNLYILSTGNANGGSGLYGFYKSTDEGETFDFMCCGTEPGGIASTSNKNIVGYAYDMDANGGQYYYDLGLGVSPDDADKIMAAGISVIRSEDGGVNWETNGHWVTWVGSNTKDRYTHADVHDVKFFKNGANVDMWVASDGGLYYSSDQGDNIEPRMHGIQGTEFWGFGSSYKEDAMIGGTYHNGTLLHYKDYYEKGKNGFDGWFAGGAGDATKGYVHDADGKVMFEGGGKLQARPRDMYWKWLAFDNTKGANQNGSAGRYGNYEWHPYYYNQFYSPRDSVLWKTEDGGVTWKNIHDFGDGAIYTIKIPVSNPDIIYVVHNDVSTVRIWKTEDAGGSWTDITPSDVTVGGNNYKNKIIDIDQDNPDNIWCLLTGGGTGNKIFKSEDGGMSWTNWTGTEIESEVVLNLAHHQGTDGGIYLGTNHSVFYRNNSHSDWQLFNDQLPMVTRCGYLYPYYTEGKIRVGTYRGVYQSDLFENAAPTARIAVDKSSSSCYRDTFYFKDLSYVDHSNVSWSWTFEGGTPSTSNEENPKVVFEDGMHDISLTVTNDYGSETLTIEDMVSVSSQCDPDSIPGKLLLTTGVNTSYAYTSMTDKFNFGNAQDFSITLWIKTNTTSSDAVIIAKKDWDSGINPGWVVSTQSGKIWLNIADGSNRVDLVPSNLINDDQWHHLACTFDRDGLAKIYLDGVEIGSSDISGIQNIDTELFTAIGTDSELDYPIAASIEEVCIYEEILDQDQIRERRHLTQENIPNNLIAYYQFNEETGDVLDRVGGTHMIMGPDALREESNCPVGKGESQKMIVDSGGVKDFSDAGVSIEFPNSGSYPDGELVISRIRLQPDKNPDGNVLANSYWVINNYGSNLTFSAIGNIVFSDIGNVTPNTFPSNLNLFKRNENDFGATWIYEDAGDDLSDPMEITFDNGLVITSFGQFSISNSKAKGWIGVVSSDWDNPANWGEGQIPDISSDVVIPANTPYQPIVNISTTIKSLTLMDGAEIKVADTIVFEIRD